MGDALVPELHDVDHVLPWLAVIADQVLDNDQVIAVVDAPNVEVQGGRGTGDATP